MVSFRAAALVIAAGLSAACVWEDAHAIGKPSSPEVKKHRLAVEYAGSRTSRNAQEHEFDVEYGITDWWSAELALEFENGAEAKSTSISNQFQFLKQHVSWLDAALKLSFEQSLQDASEHSLEAKLLLQRKEGKFTHVANLALEQALGDDSQGGPQRKLVWSSRYHYRDHLAPGVELQSEFGKAGDDLGFQEQEHYIGPSLHGTITGRLKYQTAYLFGITDGAEDSAVRLVLKYEM